MSDYMQEAKRLAEFLDQSADSSWWGNRVEMSKSTIRRTADVLRTLLAHIERGRVPDGCKPVPVDPTDAMLAAGWGYWLNVMEPGKQRDTAAKEYAGMLAAAPAAPDHSGDAAELGPEFSDSARAALLWVLWHHQGGSSPVGQPIRFALGMGRHEHLSDWQVAEAKRWGELRGFDPGDCRESPTVPARTIRLYAWRPNGHGSYSFFVAAESEGQARAAVQAEVDALIAAGRSYETCGWGTDYYEMECVEINEVLTNDNS